MNDTVPKPSRWRRLTRHPVFPLLVYLVLTQVIRENYPFSHYPMYSRPGPGPLDIQFLADGENHPLPVVWHTGVTASKVAKLHGNRLKKLHDQKAAADDVLLFLREANTERRGRELPAQIRLVESRLSFVDGRIVESQRVLAENSVAPKP